jgi:pyrimidine-nucleoside phosphorylase
MHGVVKTIQEGEAKVAEALSSGKALQKFKEMLQCQGVDAKIADTVCNGDMWTILPKAKYTTDLPAPVAGSYWTLIQNSQNF